MQNAEQIPLSISKCIVLSGGFLGNSKIVMDVEATIDGVDFMNTKLGTQLALVGPKSKFGKKFIPVGLKNYLKQLRDNKIDQLIRAHIIDSDPMADADIVPDINNRVKSFADAKIEDVIDVIVPALELPGRELPSTTFKMLSCNKRSVGLVMECSIASIEWLHNACEHDWSAGRELGDGIDNDIERILKETLPESIKYKMKGAGVVSLRTYTRKRKGDRFLTRQQTINLHGCDDSATKVLIEVAVQQLLSKPP